MTPIPMPPATLNGYPVIAERMLDVDTYLIMCYRRNHSWHRYVIAKWSVHDPDCWQNGCYIADFNDAAEAWKERIS